MAKKQIVSNKTAESAPVSPLIVDNVDALKARMAEVRAAQQEFATFTQEQVDKIFQAAAIAANQMRIPLAKMAVEETGMGVVEDKVIKNNYAAEYIYNAYKNTKTCDIIEEDKAFGTMKVAEPIGVVAAVIPTTNPTSTAIFKTLICLKTRNGIIISPHPRAKKSTIAAAKVVLDAAVAAGAPKGIIAWIDVPSLDLTNEVMRSADIILATGGPGMVKAAYSSGKPALGVGAGNTPAIIDTTADIKLAVASIVHSKTFDNGMICASEQSVIVLDKIYDKVKKEFASLGCYFLNPEETEKVRKTILINGALNAKIVGQKAATIAELAGVKVDPKTKVLIGEVESVDIEEEFAHEKLSPVLAMYKAKDFEDAVAKAEKLVADGGYGHTSSLYCNAVTEREKINEFGNRIEKNKQLIDPKNCVTHKEMQAKVIDGIRNYFKYELGRPELLNRIGEDNIVVYDFIRPDVAESILKLHINRVKVDFRDNSEIEIDTSAIEKVLLEKCCSSEVLEYGGRGIRNTVESCLYTPLTRFIYDHQDTVTAGKAIVIRSLDLNSSPVGIDAEVEE